MTLYKLTDENDQTYEGCQWGEGITYAPNWRGGYRMDYKKFYDDIAIHVEMMVTPEMRRHACADPVHHDLSFQIFRLLSGYDEALKELDKLRPANIQQLLQPDSTQ